MDTVTLQAVAERLRAATLASRTTIRVVDASGQPALIAESRAEGVPSMHDGPTPAIVAAPTYTELERTRAILVQDDCRTQGPRPPASLVERYRVYAQMLSPVFVADQMIATISVHQQDTTRHWTEADVTALRTATAEVDTTLSSTMQERQAMAQQGTTTIPVIDISGADHGSAREAEVVAAIAHACDTVGFFGITGSGVPREVIDGVYAAAREFFALPTPDKLAVGRPREGVNRGYIAPGTESLARLNLQDTPPDCKEVFTVGPEDYPEDEYHTCEQARSYWVRNRWPTALPSFRRDVLTYRRAAEDLAERLARWFCLALDLPEQFLYERFATGPGQLRLIHYPPQPDGHAPGQLRAGEHTDSGIFGILHSNSNSDGGLEVRTRDGRWEKAPTFDGFVINIGDALMRWTNDRFVSTPHRVVNPEASDGGTSRISVVFFPILNYDVVVDSAVAAHGAASHYAPITFGEYGSARFASTANASSM